MPAGFRRRFPMCLSRLKKSPFGRGMWFAPIFCHGRSKKKWERSKKNIDFYGRIWYIYTMEIRDTHTMEVPMVATTPYDLRKARQAHSGGRLDKAGRWYPSEEDRCECCAANRKPSSAFPWSYDVVAVLLARYRTRSHVKTLSQKEGGHR